MKIRDILAFPMIYQLFQNAGGFFSARLKAIKAHLPLNGDETILDIGCGPGYIAKYLPKGVKYCGYDTDQKYIDFAKANFGDKGDFVCSLFNHNAAILHGKSDVVMMNGVLHHLSDDQVDQTLEVVKRTLGVNGRLFTLDGCFVEGQPALARILLQYDRGPYVRTVDHYRKLVAKHFDSVDIHIEHSLSWVPYTWIVMIGRNE